LSGAAIFTLATLAVAFLLMTFTALSPDVILIACVTLLMVTGILTPKEALAGMANEGMITVAVLFVVGAGVIETGGVSWLADRLFGRPKSSTQAIARLMGPTAFISAFMNNTPLVAMLIPAVADWAKQYRIAPSKLMIPLSYAAILGGCCTLIGTSTNLVVDGLLIQTHDQQMAEYGQSVLPRGMSMFDITWVGVPSALVGIGFIMLTNRWLLPNRQPALDQSTDPREYTVEMVVAKDGPLVGKTIEQAGLRHLPGVFLAEIDRAGFVLPAVAPDERLSGDDRLIFVGIVESVIDLHKIRGLLPAPDQVSKLAGPRSSRCLIEAVVSDTCPAANRTIRDANFRSVYNAVVVAVARHGERIHKKIGDIVLRAGDTLLLEANPSFYNQQRNSRDFFLVSRLENTNPPRHERSVIALAILLGMVILVTIGENSEDAGITLGSFRFNFSSITMLKASMVAAGLMLATRCMSINQARRSVDWQTLLAIAASFGLGAALEKTGAASVIGTWMTDMSGGSPWWTLAAVYGVTLLATEIVTNNAAAALMFPFAVATADTLDANPIPFLIAVMMAASAGFATPIGYQTNLMVYGPGGYRFSDYVKIGVPLDILVWVVTVGLAPLVWPF